MMPPSPSPGTAGTGSGLPRIVRKPSRSPAGKLKGPSPCGHRFIPLLAILLLYPSFAKAIDRFGTPSPPRFEEISLVFGETAAASPPKKAAGQNPPRTGELLAQTPTETGSFQLDAPISRNRPAPPRGPISGANRLCLALLFGLILLAAALWNQRRRWREAETALRELNAGLERRVADRTADLAETEDRLRRLSDNLPDSAVFQYTHEPDGRVRFLYFSAGIETLNGVSPEDILRDPETLHRQFPPKYRERLAEAEARSARELSDFDMETPMRRPDGEVRWMRLKSRPRRAPDGRVVWDGVQTDVTALKRTEAALRESERRVRRKLENVLSPEDDPGDLEIPDILDPEAVQKLMDEFYALTGVPMSVIDLEGRLLVGVGWQDICTRFHRKHPETRSNCLESDLRLSAGLKRGECRLYKCRNHLWDMATPLFVANRHVGNIFTGQFFLKDENVDRDSFRNQARAYGFDEADYMASLDRVPCLDRETVDRGMAFFIQLADILSHLGHANLSLARIVGERDRLNKALRESAETLDERTRQLDAILSSVQDYVYIFNPEGRFVFANKRLLDLWGLSAEAAQGKTMGELDYPEAAVAALWAAVREVFRKGAVVTNETRYAAPTGSDGYYENVLAPMRDASGQIAFVAGSSRDITDRKQTEAVLLESEARLRASLAEKEVMLKEIHHRVKNNMQVISSLVSLQSNEIADETARVALADVTHRVRSMALVHEKLYQSEDLARVDLAEYAESLLNYLWRAHGTRASGVQLRPNLESAPVSVEAAVPFGLILNELVGNALKHAFADLTEGRVEVSLRCDADGQVLLRVRDDGPGLPPQLEWRNPSTLGLRLVGMLARQLRGDLSVVSNDGAEFTLLFCGICKETGGTMGESPG